MGCRFHKRILKEDDYEARVSLYSDYYETIYQLLRTHIPENEQQRINMDQLSDYSDIFEDAIVLDFGCGTGEVARLLSKRAKFVYGLDASSSKIETSIKLSKGLENVEFKVSSDLKLPFEDGSIDSVHSRDLLEHLHPADADLHFQEVLRVLKVGGRYLFWTPGSSTGPHDCTQCFYPRGVGIKAMADHLKEYTFQEVKEVVEKNGFNKIEFPNKKAEVLAIATK